MPHFKINNMKQDTQDQNAGNFTMDPNPPNIPPKDGSTSGPNTEPVSKIQNLIAAGGATADQLQDVLSSLGVVSDNTIVETLPNSGDKASVSRSKK